MASYAIHTSSTTCCSRTKTCPRRAATIPGAGAVRGKRSQLAARFSCGTCRPNTRKAAPQPQKDRGHPAGRPPTMRAPETLTVVAAVPASVTVRCFERYACNEDLATRSRRDCEFEKSQAWSRCIRQLEECGRVVLPMG